jgi:hypothetical protein
MKKEVVVLIIVHKSLLTDFEEISLRQCFRMFQGRDIVIVCPKGLDISAYRTISSSAVFDFIDARWQASYKMFNRLKIDPFLYKRYRQYEYILFYELDSFVFRDELDVWCNKQFDYIGAPWFKDFSNNPKNTETIGVGNGGFSLRKVASHLKVLESFSYISHPAENWHDRFRNNPKGKDRIRKIAGFILDLTVRNNTFWLFNNFRTNEDLFWGLHAGNNFDWFTVAPVDQAIAFSFEMNPEYLYRVNGRRLPFGCHAWWKYSLNFWKPHIESFGYNLKQLP